MSLEEKINQFLSQTDVFLHSANMLTRMQDLMQILDNPEKHLKIIHVAGTSGKTSTSYFAASLLHSAGYTTGLTVSPHIDSVRERAIVDLKPLSEGDWTAHMTEFFDIVRSSSVKPSYFEFYMGFAYWLFEKLRLDYVVVETGLGGTWDGSNVATRPDKVCIITDIGYDHTEVFGDDLATIASEKAGIIHPDNTVFIYPQTPAALNTIKSRAKNTHSDLHIIPDVTTNFMARNFNLARQAIDFTLTRDHHAPLTPEQLKQARTILIPARAEQATYRGKELIMDGSHNPQKLQSFVEYLNQKYPSPSRTLLVTFGSNKLATLEDSMKILRKISDNIVLTSFQNNSIETNKRTSIDEQSLVSAAEKAGFKTISYIHDPLAALDKTAEQPSDQIVITGSFYLFDHLRPHIFAESKN